MYYIHVLVNEVLKKKVWSSCYSNCRQLKLKKQLVSRIYFQTYEKTTKLKPDVLRFVSEEYTSF